MNPRRPACSCDRRLRRRRFRASALLVACFAAALPALRSLPAQTLVKDFNTTPSPEPGSSNPGGFVPLPGGRMLLVMRTPETGAELWTTDGTVAGTSLLVELVPGAADGGIQQLTELTTGVYLFTASTPGTGMELWRTDGTAAGTFLVNQFYELFD
jgi:ELWxxDGT repeat protein